MAVATFLLDPVISTGVGRALALQGHSFTFQAKVEGTGAVTATIIVQVSNDTETWFDLVTFTLTGMTTDSDGEAVEAPWAFARGKVSAITGTGAEASILMGIAA